MSVHNLPASAARALALAELEHNSAELFDVFIFNAPELGLAEGEQVVIKYHKYLRDSGKQNLESWMMAAAVPEYDGAGVA